MTVVHLRPVSAIATLAAIVTLLFGVTACGDNGGDGDQAVDTGAAAADRPAAEPSTAEDEITAVIRRTGALYEQRNAAGVCANMTRANQAARAAEAASLAELLNAKAPTNGEASCESSLDIVLQGNVSEDFTPEILSVRVEGNRARVLGDVSHDESHQTAILAKEDGRWKVARWFAHPGAASSGS
jgi:hypothetical protein